MTNGVRDSGDSVPNAFPLHVAHTIYRLAPTSGGVAQALVQLIHHTSEPHSLQHSILTTDGELSEGFSVHGADLRVDAASGAGGLQRTLLGFAEGSHGCVFHDHGQWMAVNRASYLAARKLAAPRVVSPHGMLMPWSMNHNRWKKRLAWAAYARRHVASADAIVVAGESEAAGLHKLGIDRPTHVIPFGIDVPPEKPPTTVRLRQVLFLGRLHRVKGILMLLEVWPRVAREGWELVIAGPDEEGLLLGRKLPSGCRYAGVIAAEAKWNAYAEADVVAAPSYTENFGFVIGEALASGTPVIATTAAPWPVLRDRSCGWWIDPNAASLEAALRDAMSRDRESLGAMGRRGRDYVRTELTWAKFAERMMSVYRGLAERR